MPDESHGASSLMRQDSEQLVGSFVNSGVQCSVTEILGWAERPTPMPAQRQKSEVDGGNRGSSSGHCGWMLRSEAHNAACAVRPFPPWRKRRSGAVSQAADPEPSLERVSAFPSSGDGSESVACDTSCPAQISSLAWSVRNETTRREAASL